MSRLATATRSKQMCSGTVREGEPWGNLTPTPSSRGGPVGHQKLQLRGCGPQARYVYIDPNAILGSLEAKSAHFTKTGNPKIELETI